jgi:hypothetical protein
MQETPRYGTPDASECAPSGSPTPCPLVLPADAGQGGGTLAIDEMGILGPAAYSAGAPWRWRSRTRPVGIARFAEELGQSLHIALMNRSARGGSLGRLHKLRTPLTALRTAVSRPVPPDRIAYLLQSRPASLGRMSDLLDLSHRVRPQALTARDRSISPRPSSVSILRDASALHPLRLERGRVP